MQSNRPALKLINAEEKFLLSRTLPELSPADQALFLALMNEYNAKRAEVLFLKNQESSELLKLRALLFRGRFSESTKLIEQMKNQNEILLEEKAEVLQEEVRLAAFEGEWHVALRLIDDILKLNPTLVTLMTLLQIRALAQYEIGNISGALGDIDRVESFRHLYSESEACLYIDTLKARIAGDGGDPQFGIELLRTHWAKYINAGRLHCNHVLTLLRTETVLRKQLGKGAINHALACMKIAEMMGDGLYASLAKLDCAFLTKGDLSENLLKQIDSEKFKRVQTLLKETETSNDEISMSGRHVQNCGQFREELTKKRYEHYLHSNILIFPSLDLKIAINPWQVTPLALSPQAKKVLTALASGSTDKTRYFRDLWGSQKYVPSLHDHLIWNSLTRIRKLVDPTGKEILIEIENAEIHCNGFLIIEI